MDGLDKSARSSTHSQRRDVSPQDGLRVILLTAGLLAVSLLLVRQLWPGSIPSLVGRFGGMSQEEERLEARLQASREKALAQVVLQLDEENRAGQQSWPDSRAPWGHIPALTLFDDGQVVYLNESGEGGSIPFAARLDPAAAQELVDEVVARGFDQLRSQESRPALARDAQGQTVGEQGFVNLRLRRDGVLTSLRIYDDEAHTADPGAYRAVVDYLRGWAAPLPAPFDPGIAVLYRLDDTTRSALADTPIEAALAQAAGPSGSLPVDWPGELGQPSRYPELVHGDVLGPLRGRLPMASEQSAPRPSTGDPGPVAEQSAEIDPLSLAALAPRSGYWGWTYRLPRIDGGVNEARFVAVPWIYGDRYPDVQSDLLAVGNAEDAVAAENAANRANEAALQAIATADAASRPATTPTAPVAGNYPFPPRVRPARLDFGLGIQTWNHWMADAAPLMALKMERTPRFTWLKQRFAWTDMEPRGPTDLTRNDLMEAADRWLDAAKATSHDYPPARVLIQLDVPPPWAKQSGDLPFDLDQWEHFVHQFAMRYAGRVDAYEILNEPNLAREWGAAPNPAAYARVLGAAFRAIKTADPMAVVISAGLAPTGTQLPAAMADDEFLGRLYDAIAASGASSDYYFDALGAHAPGYAAEPGIAPEQAAVSTVLGGQRYFTFRRVEDLRRIMIERGDDFKQVVITEFGWTIDSRPDSPYHWFAVSEHQRATNISAAHEFARVNWAAWIGPLILFSAADPAWSPSDEAWWWSVTRRDGSLRPEIRAAFRSQPVE